MGAGAAGLGAYGMQLLVRPSPPGVAPEAGLQQVREPSTGAIVLQRPDGNVLLKEFDGRVKAVPPESVARLLGDQYGGYEAATAEGIAAEHRRIWERDRDNEAVERSALAALLVGAGVFLRGLKKAFVGSKSAPA